MGLGKYTLDDLLVNEETFEEPEEPSYDERLMIQELIEYQLGFLSFSDLVAIVKTNLRESYEKKDYTNLLREYNQIFGDIYNDDD